MTAASFKPQNENPIPGRAYKFRDSLGINFSKKKIRAGKKLIWRNVETRTRGDACSCHFSRLIRQGARDWFFLSLSSRHVCCVYSCINTLIRLLYSQFFSSYWYVSFRLSYFFDFMYVTTVILFDTASVFYRSRVIKLIELSLIEICPIEMAWTEVNG